MQASDRSSATTDALDEAGFALVPDVLDPATRLMLIHALGPVSHAGRRGVLSTAEVAALARSERIAALVRPYLGGEPFPVRAIYFDKSASSNWLVPWHQDLTIAVRAHAEVAGYGPWSKKEGVPHVQPPTAVLEQMLAVRVHLDDADESSGALQVLPGTHRRGRLPAEEIEQLRGSTTSVVCAVKAGDVMLMRPLLLHASGRMSRDVHRRVLHLEYAASRLPEPLEWHAAS